MTLEMENVSIYETVSMRQCYLLIIGIISIGSFESFISNYDVVNFQNNTDD